MFKFSKSYILIFLLTISIKLFSQNKMGYTWIVGNNASYGQFDGSNNHPQTGSLYNTSSPNYPYLFTSGHSNICDSSTGKLVFLCNGMIIFDTVGNIIENGDSLMPYKIYTLNSYPSATTTQGSLILPKGSNNEYYVFIPTVTDTTFDKWFLPNATTTPYDMLLYNVVDMNANSGMGKVVKKNIPLLTNTEMSRTNMQACRHSNGVDWWLMKKVGLATNKIARFLITNDSIYGPFYQTFSEPDFGIYDATGQCAFNKDGTKFASVQGKSNKLFVANFDRCTGELNNPLVYNIPIDSTGNPYVDSLNWKDSISSGVCFSPNSQFVYISKLTNIYQFEFENPDSNLAWYNLKRGADTTWLAFEDYGSLRIGIDNRIYIGKRAGGFKQFSVIDTPNNKGAACSFCRKCFRVDSALGGLNSPPNMPDYTLGASGQLCWPVGMNQILFQEFKLYPNPTNGMINIEGNKLNGLENEIVIYDLLGRDVLRRRTRTTNGKIQIDCSALNEGIYLLSCNGEIAKIVIQ